MLAQRRPEDAAHVAQVRAANTKGLVGCMRHFGDRDFGVYTNGLRRDPTLNLAVEPEGADLKPTFAFAEVWPCLDLGDQLGQSGG